MSVLIKLSFCNQIIRQGPRIVGWFHEFRKCENECGKNCRRITARCSFDVRLRSFDRDRWVMLLLSGFVDIKLLAKKKTF